MKNVLIAVAFVLFVVALTAWTKPHELADDEVVTLRIEDEINGDTMKAVRAAIESAKNPKIKAMRVYLFSPGGHAFVGFEAARQLRKLSDSGKLVEMHAEGFCASACTFILASGTPGHRFIAPHAFFLVHPLQRGGLMGMKCVERKAEPKDVDERAGNTILDIGVELYMQFTGKDRATVEDWMTCGHEQVGQSRLAVELGIADKVEG